MSDIQINSIVFSDDGMAIQYIEVPTDIRAKGQLIQTHTLQLVASHPDYREDTESLHTRAVKALRNALEDFANSEPHTPTDGQGDFETDDERGMGE